MDKRKEHVLIQLRLYKDRDADLIALLRPKTDEDRGAELKAILREWLILKKYADSGTEAVTKPLAEAAAETTDSIGSLDRGFFFTKLRTIIESALSDMAGKITVVSNQAVSNTPQHSEADDLLALFGSSAVFDDDEGGGK